MREIEDIKKERTDIDDYLVHLTKNIENRTAKEALKQILNEKRLICSNMPHSSIRYIFGEEEREKISKEGCFSSICFTETPLDNIKLLVCPIKSRKVNLQQYGIAFYKKSLRKKGVSPIFYLNNYVDENEDLITNLVRTINATPDLAKNFLPLLEHFGNYLKDPDYASRRCDILDFSWEREWRYPYCKGDLTFDYEDICLGFCKQNEIDEFEQLYTGLIFIDPTENFQQYSLKIQDAEKEKLRIKEEEREKRDPWSGLLTSEIIS